MSLAERFARHVDISGGPDACHLWTGATNDGGYGVMRPEGRRTGPTVKASHVALELVGITIPAGQGALHSCDNPPCANAKHLRPGTPLENAADRVRRGREFTKLTADQVLDIRARYAAGETQVALGVAYGVTQAAVSAIVLRKTWTHV